MSVDMLGAIRQFLSSQLALIDRESTDAAKAERGYQLATAALLLEMTRADFEIAPEELDAVVAAIKRAFALTDQETQNLLELAELEVEQAVSLHEFTSTINAYLSPDQKDHVVELLWEIAFADGKLDKYEDHLVRKVADLLHVRHRDFIKAKHKVQAKLDL